MPPIEKLREYTNTVCNQVRWKKAREAVSEEIHSHLMDQREAYIQEGTSEETATEQAIADMGDPVSVGTQLDRVHRPKPQWSMLGLILVMVAVGILLQVLVQDDVGKHYQGIWLVGIQLKFILVGAAALLAAYFADFTLIGKYPKTVYLGLLGLYALLFVFEIQNNANPSFINRYFYFRAYCPLFFPVAFTGIVYTMRKKEVPGILVCITACFLPAFLAWQEPRNYPTLTGAVLIMLSGAVILGIAMTRNWFGAKCPQYWLWMYLPFLGATVLFISQYLQTSYGLERIKVLLHPEKAPEEGGYAAMVIKGLLENAKLIGTGDIPARYTGSSKFPLGALHTDYMLTYLIHRMGWLAFGVVIALFITFILLGVRQCLSQKSVLGQLVSVSVLLTFSFQTVHYIGYNLGFQFMAPLSLPLVSYGGVTMVVNMGLLGLLLSVFRNGSAARDRAQSSSARQPFITWRERKLVIDFGRKNGE